MLSSWIDRVKEWGARVADTVCGAFVPRPKPIPVRTKDDHGQPRRRAAWVLAGAMALTISCATLAAHAQSSNTKPAWKKKHVVAKARKPVAKPKVDIKLGETFMSSDLDRVFVGNQAGILKIYNREHTTIIFTKDAPGTDMVGVDGSQWAPILDKHRQAILGCLGITDNENVAVAGALMTNFNAISAQEARAAVAMLGLFGSYPDAQHLPPQLGSQIRAFLSDLLTSSKNVSMRRQAVLSLALCNETDEATVKSVITFMTASHNAWETYTTRQFFEFHKDYIRSLASLPELRQMLAASGNPYSTDIIALLN